LNQLSFRKVHRWLGIIAGIQLFLWTGSGLFFALIPIDDIRGSHLLTPSPVFRLGHVKLLSPSSLASQHEELSAVSVDQVKIKQRLYTPIYVVQNDGNWLVYDAESGEKLAPVTETEANSIASNSTKLPVLSAVWVTSTESGSEYRDGELPAWKIELEGPDHPILWIGGNTGQVVAIRTTRWRIYDFLWSLHIMDYVHRDNFNSWLLRGFALLGVVTILSGIVLFVSSRQRRRKLPTN
jgi:uncharacterized iron-regulated membrane protein